MARDKPDLPDDPRESLPDPNRDCPECGDSRRRTGRDSDSERLRGSGLYRVDYWCPECGAYVGGRVDYDGPVPVRVPGGTELH